MNEWTGYWIAGGMLLAVIVFTINHKRRKTRKKKK
jgi:hypothetical protein